VGIRAGYKKTEVGVIPLDWDAVAVGNLARFSSGKGISVAALRQQSSDFPVPVFGGNGIAGYTNSSFISIPCVVVGRVGQKCGEVYLTEGAAWITDNALYPKKILRDFDVHFFALALEAAGLNNVKNRNDLPLVTQSILHSQRVLWPPTVREQRAIAEALSDVDELLGGLDRLIAKKRDLKQAAMQQLFTGQTRLPGFHGEWVVKRLGDLFNFSGGYSASRDQLSSEGHCYLHYGDIHGSTKTCIDTDADFQDIPKLDIPLKHVSSASLLDDGDVVFVDASEDDAGTSKHVVVVNKNKKPFISGLHTIVAKSKTDELAHDFRCYCFQTPAIRQQFLFYSVGTKVSGISKSNIPKLTLSFPGVPEQTAITEVLTDMDAELAGLEQRREKTRALKQAMMQGLLTGKTRLITGAEMEVTA